MTWPLSRREFLKLLLWLSLSPFPGVGSRLAEARNRSSHNQGMPNVLILIFDTLSARQMSLYGYHRNTTPHLTAFAEHATVYHNHYAAGNFTTSGTASLLTGTYPWVHRALHLHGTVTEGAKHRNVFRAFDSEPYTRFAYTQNAFADIVLQQFHEDLDVSIDQNEFSLGRAELFPRAFTHDEFIASRAEEFLLGGGLRSSLFLSFLHNTWWRAYEKRVTKQQGGRYPLGMPSDFGSFFLFDRVIDGVAAAIRRVRQPFLAYVHLMPPHEPYTPSREFVGLFNDGWTPVAKPAHVFSMGLRDQPLNRARQEYNEYTADADAQFGRFHDFMRRTGLLDTTYFVFTSDHGEMFERGIRGHNTPTLYEPIIRVPLLISAPGQQQRQDVYAPTSCVDLLPTLLHFTGRPIPEWCEGQVLPPFSGREADFGRSIFSVEAKSNPKLAPLKKATVALVKERYKLIHYFGYPGYESKFELYDRAGDPEELQDLYGSRKSIASDLRNELETKLRTVNQLFVGR